jgi:hypothetical protein
MFRRMLTSAVVLSVVTCAAFAADATSQPAADALAKKVLDVMAGPSWEKDRYFAFTFNVEREGKIAASFPQSWDRYTGDYRVSGKDKEGHDFLVIMNTNTKTGRGWVDGKEAADPKELLTVGYRRFINDTYWLLMPLKMMDPGVHRELAEEKKGDAGETYDRIHLWFDNVGLTPGDQYWAWVNHATGRVEQWEMKLQGTKPEDAPLMVKFHDFKKVGGLLISQNREIVGKNQTIKLDDLVVATEVPAGAFKP